MRHLAVGLLVLVAPLAQPSNADAADLFSELADEAERANPGIHALEAQVAALDAKAEAMRMWMDPMLAVEYSSFPWNTWSFGDSPMTGIQFKLTQQIPFPGKNDRRQATARGDLAAKQLERDELVVQLRAKVRLAVIELALVRQLKALTVEHITKVNQLLERVQLRYETGRGNQQDVLRLMVMRDKLTDDLEQFERQDVAITATINGARHREPRTPIETPEQLVVDEPRLDADQLRELATQRRPLLAQLAQQARTRRLAADQAEWERRPDFSVWVGYRMRYPSGMDDGTDFLSIGAAVPLPFDYTGNAAAQKRQQLELAAAFEHQQSAAVDQIAVEIERNLAAWRRAISKAATYRDELLPRAQQSLEAALASYETARTEFFTVYRAQIDLIDFARAVRMAEAEAATSKVTIEMLIGGDPEQPQQPRSDR